MNRSPQPEWSIREFGQRSGYRGDVDLQASGGTAFFPDLAPGGDPPPFAALAIASIAEVFDATSVPLEIRRVVPFPLDEEEICRP